MKPHRWRVGDVLRTNYGYVGRVTDKTVYSVTLDNRVHMSQTVIKEKLSEQEAAREIRHIREDKKATREVKAGSGRIQRSVGNASRTSDDRERSSHTEAVRREKLQSRTDQAEQLGFSFGNGDGPERPAQRTRPGGRLR